MVCISVNQDFSRNVDSSRLPLPVYLFSAWNYECLGFLTRHICSSVYKKLFFTCFCTQACVCYERDLTLGPGYNELGFLHPFARCKQAPVCMTEFDCHVSVFPTKNKRMPDALTCFCYRLADRFHVSANISISLCSDVFCSDCFVSSSWMLSCRLLKLSKNVWHTISN